MAELVDFLRESVPIPDDMVRDDTLAEPMDYLPGNLYAWPGTEQLIEDGDGSQDRDVFTVNLAVSIPSDEQSGGVPLRDTSIALDDALEDVTDWVRAHRFDYAHTPPYWVDLQARVMWPGVRGFDHRTVRVELSGYRYVS